MTEEDFGLTLMGSHIDCLTAATKGESSSQSESTTFQGWKADTCCGMHMTSRKELF